MPCSYAQQRLWFIDQWRPGIPAYNMSVAMRLIGALSVSALRAALDQLVSRHETLRTAFVLQEGEPFQHIALQAAVQMPLCDLSGRAPRQARSEALDLAREFAQQPFELAVAPLLRALLVRIEAQEHLLVLVMHHIVSDGWSMSVLFGDLSSLYRAQVEGSQLLLPDLPVQYADYALWQRERLKQNRLERELGYWRKRLEGLRNLELPTDRPRPHTPSYRGARQPVLIDAELGKALKRLGAAQQCTLYMTLLAAFQVLLYRYSDQSDFAVGSPIAGRNDHRLEGLIGFFVNTLVLRADVSADLSFVELLARVRESALDAYAYQELPFEKLVEELKPRRDPSRNPLVQVMFALQNVPREELSLPGVRCSSVQLGTDTAKFDLTLTLSEESDGIGGHLEYATDLFDAKTIEQMVGHWRVLLEGIVGDPGQAISQLPLLTEAERHQLLFEWNDTAVEYPRERCIQQLFEAQVERSPRATALVYEDQQLTYGELNARANRLAHHLRSLGVGPEVLVGVCLERSLELVVGLLAILKAGGAYVPLDPSYPAERLAFMLQDTQAPVLLTQQHLLARLPAYAGHTLCLEREAAHTAQHPDTNPPTSATPTNLAYVIYTSGSTGTPKGVMVEQRAVVRLVRNADYVRLGPDRWRRAGLQRIVRRRHVRGLGGPAQRSPPGGAPDGDADGCAEPGRGDHVAAHHHAIPDDGALQPPRPRLAAAIRGADSPALRWREGGPGLGPAGARARSAPPARPRLRSDRDDDVCDLVRRHGSERAARSRSHRPADLQYDRPYRESRWAATAHRRRG